MQLNKKASLKNQEKNKLKKALTLRLILYIYKSKCESRYLFSNILLAFFFTETECILLTSSLTSWNI